MAYQRAMEGRPSPCRFTPSCSSYAVESLRLHGSLRGSWLTLRRLLRCRPFGPSGWDPVPLPTRDRHAAPSSPLTSHSTSHSTTLTTSHTSPHSTPRQDKGLFA